MSAAVIPFRYDVRESGRRVAIACGPVKTCLTCGAEKPFTEFYPNPKIKAGEWVDYRGAHCKPCARNVSVKARAQKRRERARREAEWDEDRTDPQPATCVCGCIKVEHNRFGEGACSCGRCEQFYERGL